MDAQQRLLLEHAWEVLSQGGTGGAMPQAERTAVMIGQGGVDHAIMTDHLGIGIFTSTGDIILLTTPMLAKSALACDKVCLTHLARTVHTCLSLFVSTAYDAVTALPLRQN